MRISLPLDLKGQKATRFLEYFRAEINFDGGYRSTNGVTPEGHFVSTASGTITVADEPTAVELRLTWSDDESLASLEALGDGPDGWQDQVQDWVRTTLLRAFSEHTEKILYKEIRTYIGAPLEGEYDGYRVAPFEPKGMGPIEQVLVLETEVDAVDDEHALRVGRARTYRFASLLSLFLRIGLVRSPTEMRWIRLEDGTHRRAILSVPRDALPRHTTKPKKGQLLPLGEYGEVDRKSITFPDPLAPLKPPRDIRLLFRTVRSLPAADEQGYMGAAALAGIATALHRDFPSASLAYWVASVDALPETDGTRAAFDRVVARLCPDAPPGVADWAFGRVRSAHFHCGALPAGEDSEVDGFTMFSGPTALGQARVSAHLPNIMHAALIRWLLERAAPKDDSDPSESTGND